ncbi:sel1 repeat family protein [Vibrio rarus]|uniref:sel1 repeat family protein n=1 Tax=Vibrio rarus TaxID=413403 RepID=UPI0021C4A041|nr:sel1 repeat family protein [Vibrio rarus]
MDTVTEIITTLAMIVLFMVVFFGIAKWFSRRSRRAEQKRVEAQKQSRIEEAERVRRHKERVAFAENGHLATQLELGKEKERKHSKEAVYWYEKAALQESREGIEGIIRVCDTSAQDVVSQDKYQYWKNALDALNGDEQAEYEQGIALFEGFGVRSNMDRGLQLIEHAANRRCLRAQMFLVNWYQSPENPLADEQKAQMWKGRMDDPADHDADS